MVKHQTKTSTLISLALHLSILGILTIFSKPIAVLIPARSDGLEVSLVSMPNHTVEPYTSKVKIATPATIQTLENSADINLTQNTQPRPTTAPKVISQPKLESKPIKSSQTDPKNMLTQQTTSKTKPLNKKAVVNDLLGDALSSSNISVRKGKALGGTAAGTSDSNNLLSNYADSVIRAVRPFVINPDDLSPKARVIVRVEINPDLSVRRVTIEKSSENISYDQNVQTAIIRVKIFPPLPDNATYVDYRILHLTFRP